MKISNTVEFGQAIRTRRKQLKYSQVFLSEFSGFSVSFISDVENGKSTAELGKVISLANILGLDISIDARGNA